MEAIEHLDRIILRGRAAEDAIESAEMAEERVIEMQDQLAQAQAENAVLRAFIQELGEQAYAVRDASRDSFAMAINNDDGFQDMLDKEQSLAESIGFKATIILGKQPEREGWNQHPDAIRIRNILASTPVQADELLRKVNAYDELREALRNLPSYDAGLLNDFGGGNTEWWQDYIRAELGRAEEHYTELIENALAQQGANTD